MEEEVGEMTSELGNDIVKYECKECGEDMEFSQLMCFPPINRFVCMGCGRTVKEEVLIKRIKK